MLVQLGFSLILGWVSAFGKLKNSIFGYYSTTITIPVSVPPSLPYVFHSRQNSVLPVSISVTKYRVTFLKNDKFGQKITENANNVKFVTKKRQLL